MKLGVLSTPFSSLDLESCLKEVSALGLQAVELHAKGPIGQNILKLPELLSGDARAKEIRALLEKYNIEISAIGGSGNPVHPDPDIRARDRKIFGDALIVAEKLGVKRVITFSGCPGDPSGSKYPNWVTCPWPEEYLGILKYQWEDVLIPYWQQASQKAKDHGVEMICIEMHPGFCVYNPETLLKLRHAAGDNIGANFDPSHLFWQGIDIVEAIRMLQGVIYHFHAKDTKVDRRNVARNGVIDTKHYGDEINRSWLFRTVGYGNGEETWKEIVSNLRMTGYDYVMSIEHEDSLMSSAEGLKKAVAFLKNVIITEPKGAMWWA
ncbi:MAG: sugar phosphate isomerase/epimerase family protein [Christensenellales bacterium]|jgi:sugar phosphate isomerase/epimerase